MPTVQVSGVWPAGYAAHIVGSYLAGQQVVGYYPNPALQFGSVTVRQVYRVGPTGLPSAQAFGAVQVKTVVVSAVTGLGSAQAFGAVVVKSVVLRAVTGVGSAQLFGVTTFKTAIVKLVGGVVSAQAFGLVTTGATTPSQTVPVGGVATAQALGLVSTTTIGLAAAVDGVASAQAFGLITATAAGLPQTVPVGAVGTAQKFGKVRIEPGRLIPSQCLPLNLDPALGATQTLDPTVCAHDEPLLLCGTFLCGERILPLHYLFSTSTQEQDLAPSPLLTLNLSPGSVSTVALAPSGQQESDLVAALTAEAVLSASACAHDDPLLLCGTFLCGERILPMRFLSPSPPQSILGLGVATSATLDLVPAEEI